MKIHLTHHTIERVEERGVSINEIEEVVFYGDSIPVKHGRLGKFKVFPFESIRQNTYYAQKRVEIIYVIEESMIVVVTVYAFYGRW